MNSSKIKGLYSVFRLKFTAMRPQKGYDCFVFSSFYFSLIAKRAAKIVFLF